MSLLREFAAKPRSHARRPNYPAIACGALFLLAACGGNVEGGGSPEGEAGDGWDSTTTDSGTGGTEQTGGAGGSGGYDAGMPTGAGAGGSYDAGVGGSGGGQVGGSGGGQVGGSGGGQVGGMGGTAGYDAGMPSGAGTAGSYDAGPPVDAGDIWDDPCIHLCIQDNPTEWAAMLEFTGPCVCSSGACDAVCGDSLCAVPAGAASDDCGSCALQQIQNSCLAELAACMGAECKTIVPCLLGCQ